jgi:hypothetical protein
MQNENQPALPVYEVIELPVEVITITSPKKDDE